jgi:hypothetical protein
LKILGSFQEKGDVANLKKKIKIDYENIHQIYVDA